MTLMLPVHAAAAAAPAGGGVIRGESRRRCSAALAKDPAERWPPPTSSPTRCEGRLPPPPPPAPAAAPPGRPPRPAEEGVRRRAGAGGGAGGGRSRLRARMVCRRGRPSAASLTCRTAHTSPSTRLWPPRATVRLPAAPDRPGRRSRARRVVAVLLVDGLGRRGRRDPRGTLGFFLVGTGDRADCSSGSCSRRSSSRPARRPASPSRVAEGDLTLPEGQSARPAKDALTSSHRARC